MKLLIQRVKKASVSVDDSTVGKINHGLLVLIGITNTDTEETASFLARKLINLRIFENEQQKMNLSLKDIEGELLIISQFTLYANCSNGNRPSFTEAAKPDYANHLYEFFITQCKEYGLTVEQGVFGAHMQIELINDGPVTILLEK